MLLLFIPFVRACCYTIAVGQCYSIYWSVVLYLDATLLSWTPTFDVCIVLLLLLHFEWMQLVLNMFFHFKFYWYVPGISQLSPYHQTLVGGFLAVFSVNVVIAFYIYLAMKEPSDKHEPDPTFVAQAKASMNQTKSGSGDKEE